MLNEDPILPDIELLSAIAGCGIPIRFHEVFIVNHLTNSVNCVDEITFDHVYSISLNILRESLTLTQAYASIKEQCHRVNDDEVENVNISDDCDFLFDGNETYILKAESATGDITFTPLISTKDVLNAFCDLHNPQIYCRGYIQRIILPSYSLLTPTLQEKISSNFLHQSYSQLKEATDVHTRIQVLDSQIKLMQQNYDEIICRKFEDRSTRQSSIIGYYRYTYKHNSLGDWKLLEPSYGSYRQYARSFLCPWLCDPCLFGISKVSAELVDIELADLCKNVIRAIRELYENILSSNETCSNSTVVDKYTTKRQLVVKRMIIDFTCISSDTESNVIDGCLSQKTSSCIGRSSTFMYRSVTISTKLIRHNSIKYQHYFSFVYLR